MPLRVAALVLFSLLALAGCGAVSSQDVTSQSETETPAPKDTLLAPTITANQVTVTTDRSTYTPGDTVRVTIANGRGASIYAVASKANCTALDVQVKMASGWQASNMTSCASQAVPNMLEIRPNSATTTTITAPSAGIYRCALQYTTINIPPPRSAPNGAIVSATSSTSGPATTVYSAEWAVKSA